eukprot:scaffold293402_cov14-Tisochrysis_lutea.AAC.1
MQPFCQAQHPKTSQFGWLSIGGPRANSSEKKSCARGVSPQALIRERGHHGCKHWENPPAPQGLDPGFTSVAGCAQGGT